MVNNIFHWQRYILPGILIILQYCVVDSSVNNTVQTIQFDSFDAIDAGDIHSHIYYMVEFSPSPYTLQENKTIDEKFIEYG